MLLRVFLIAICLSFAGFSAAQTPWDSSVKDRAVEGSGAGGGALSWPGGINDDEDDPRGRASSPVEGSGAATVGSRYDEEPDEDSRVPEGSGGGPPPDSYPKPNRNDESGWQTPWEPGKKSDDLPGPKSSDKKPKGNKNKPPIDADEDFTSTATNNKPAPAPGNDVSNTIDHGKKTVGEDVHIVGHGAASDRPASFFAQPGILAAVIGGVVVGLLCTVLLLMYIVYRMRKMDEGSYPLEEPRKTPSNKQSQEFFA